jgi:hypothetical protein
MATRLNTTFAGAGEAAGSKVLPASGTLTWLTPCRSKAANRGSNQSGCS